MSRRNRNAKPANPAKPFVAIRSYLPLDPENRNPVGEGLRSQAYPSPSTPPRKLLTSRRPSCWQYAEREVSSWLRQKGRGIGSVTHRPQLSGLLADRSGDGRALHLTLGVDDLQRIVSAPCPQLHATLIKFPIPTSILSQTGRPQVRVGKPVTVRSSHMSDSRALSSGNQSLTTPALSSK